MGGGCSPPGFQITNDNGTYGTCAFSPTTEASWTEAHELCKIEYSMLATIFNIERQEAIESYLSSFNNRWTQYWLGGTDAFSPNDWVYFEHGLIPVSEGYTNWNPRHPRNDGNRNCMYINIGGPAPGTWGADDCNKKKPFVCLLSMAG
ncbi:hypothetical protein ScPMuIL_002434 [Solemya velum]